MLAIAIMAPLICYGQDGAQEDDVHYEAAAQVTLFAQIGAASAPSQMVFAVLGPGVAIKLTPFRTVKKWFMQLGGSYGLHTIVEAGAGYLLGPRFQVGAGFARLRVYDQGSHSAIWNITSSSNGTTALYLSAGLAGSGVLIETNFYLGFDSFHYYRWYNYNDDTERRSILPVVIAFRVGWTI